MNPPSPERSATSRTQPGTNLFRAGWYSKMYPPSRGASPRAT